MKPDCQVELVPFPDFDFVISCEVVDAPPALEECTPAAILPEALRFIGPGGAEVRGAFASSNISRNATGLICFATGAVGSEIAGGTCVLAYNRFGLILAGWWVWVMFLNGAWQIVWAVVPDCQDLMDPTAHEGWDDGSTQVLQHTADGENWCFEWEDAGDCTES